MPVRRLQSQRCSAQPTPASNGDAMVIERLKNLEGNSRRNFLRFTAAVGAVLALDRSRVLDVISDTGGTALAEEACSPNCRSVHLVAGNGGFAWFQLLW